MGKKLIPIALGLWLPLSWAFAVNARELLPLNLIKSIP